MLKLLHISDIHLGANLKVFTEKASKQRGNIAVSLKRAVDIAAKHEVAAVIITGDVFDHYYPSQTIISTFVEAIKPLLQKGIYVVVLPGNHDRLEKQSVWQVFPIGAEDYWNRFKVIGRNNQDVEMLNLPDLGISFLGRGTYTQKSKQSPLAGIEALLKTTDIQDLKVVLAHGSVSLAQEAENFPISKEEIAQLGADYLALGDWHGLLDVSQGEQVAFYPGSLEYLNTDQAQSGQALLVAIEKNKKTTVTPVKVSELRLERLEINLEQIQPENIYAEIKAKADPNLILSVHLHGKLNVGAKSGFDLEKIKSDLNENFFWLGLSDKSETILDFTNFTNFPKGSLPHGFIELLQAEIKSGKISEADASAVLNLGLRTILS